jgi:hypothetical protein
MSRQMCIYREVEIQPDQILFYLDSSLLCVRTNEKDESGHERIPITYQHVVLDFYAKELVEKLTEWALTQLK